MKANLTRWRGAATSILAVSVAASLLAPAAVAGGAVDGGDHGAQVRCMYISVQPPAGWSGLMKLRRIRVLPPILFATQSSSNVGWRFAVQRRYDSGSWKRIFTSVVQKRPATTSEPAAFGELSAAIKTPAFLPNGIGADYRVILRFYWYAPDGTTVRRERHRVLDYDVFRDGSYQWTDARACHHSWIFE